MKKIVFMVMLCFILNSCKKEMSETDQAVVMTNDQLPAVDYDGFGMDATTIPKGLNVGEKVPDLLFWTPDHKQRSLASYYQKQPLVVIFYRGYWCPICSKHLSEFAQKAKEIELAGAKLIAFSSESYENVAKTKSQTGADFTIISDSDGSIMKAFDVNFKVTDKYQEMIEDKLHASIREANANKKPELPVPATFIIDQSGKVIYKQFNPDYKVRATMNDILKNLPK